MLHLGDFISYSRKKSGVSASALSKACGYSPSYVSKVESGKIEPSMKAFCKMAMALGLNTHEIVWLVRIVASQEDQ